MTPIRTAETTGELQPHPQDADHVDPLPSYVEDGAIVSIWEPTQEELAEIGLRFDEGSWRRFGVRLDVLGDSPPVRLTLVTLHETPDLERVRSPEPG